MTALATQPGPRSLTSEGQGSVRICAGYVRLTRDESLKGLSASAQRQNINEYAARAGLEPLRIYEETRPVGGDVPFSKREAGRRLLTDIRAGAVGAVIVRDLDRLTRDVPLWLELHKICVEQGVTIHTLSGV